MRRREPRAEQAPADGFWVTPEVPGLELQRAAYTRWAFPKHSHDVFSLCAYDAGAEALHLQGQRVVASAGSLLAVAPGEMHEGRAADSGVGWAYRILYIPPALLTRAAEEAGAPAGTLPGFAAPVLEDSRLLGSFTATFEALKDGAAARLEREERLLGLLVALLRRHAGVGRRGRRTPACTPGVRRARALLEEDVTRNVSLEELARAARLSPWHLVRAFHQQLGQTPQVYQRALRLRRAQELLAGPLPMAEVALASGFTDQSHLIKHFGRTLGVTPGAYRAAVRSGLEAQRKHVQYGAPAPL
ncbi:AraC family transcriptional regulator [Pyxidicoccus xibeiensis]|uniref:AraC family transcriptional regulator n=1 Tax=Pyxidicoccus xibeiensis TaxID=2906759 RepID=UPI0020A73BF4|nr:AraC family transcriptional regulator [Pyxidicoccus xibeiensis]MCP3141883.1 AraC family transcriptional regulator [Pyxidicoccus xibeiensis]